MPRLVFRWTDWSTPPITCAIIVTCWALMFLLAAGVAALFGRTGGAHTALALTRAFLTGGAALLGVAALAGVGTIPRDPGGSIERSAPR